MEPVVQIYWQETQDFLDIPPHTYDCIIMKEVGNVVTDNVTKNTLIIEPNTSVDINHANDLSEKHSTTDSNPKSGSCYVQIRLNTLKNQNYIIGNLDTGASRSIVSQDIYSKYFTDCPLINNACGIRGINSTVNSIGSARLKFFIDNEPFVWNFIVFALYLLFNL